MNVFRMWVVIGIVVIQATLVNAQLRNVGNLLNKTLNKQIAPTNQPAIGQSDATTNKEGLKFFGDTRTIGNSQNAEVSGLKTSTSDFPSIFEAAKKCNDVQFAALLKKDISAVGKTLYDMNWGRDGDDRYAEDKFGNRIFNYTLLDVAAANGCTNIIQQLLDMDTEVNPQVVSPISLAAGNGHSEAVKMLLKAKANPQKAMAAAVEGGEVEMLKTLVEAGATGGERLLEGAVVNGKLNIVQILLKLPKEPGETDEYGFTRRKAFRKAIEGGSLAIVKAFVAADEEVSDSRDNDDKRMMRGNLFQIAIRANQGDILTYLKAVKKDQAIELAEKKAAIAKKETAEQEKVKAAKKQAVQKEVLTLLDNPSDAFGIANSRYRKFNGTVYDCAEPIEFLNRLHAFLLVEAQYHDNPSSLDEIKGRVEAESKWVHENPWYKIRNDCSLLPVLVKQVAPDGLIVRLNSKQDVEHLVLLKNHPKQTTVVDGDAIINQLFVIKTNPYQYTDVNGAIRTILSYDMGEVVPAPSGSVPKLPIPDYIN